MGATGPAFYTNRRRQPGQFPRQAGRGQPVQSAIEGMNRVAVARQPGKPLAGILLLEQIQAGAQGLGVWRAALLQRLGDLADQ